MKLRQVTMSNFMPYKARTRIDFPMDDYRNVMLVFGDNMRGKTSILNALRWGFTEGHWAAIRRKFPCTNF
jgi:DNA sulfur modification protein DndD